VQAHKNMKLPNDIKAGASLSLNIQKDN